MKRVVNSSKRNQPTKGYQDYFYDIQSGKVSTKDDEVNSKYLGRFLSLEEAKRCADVTYKVTSADSAGVEPAYAPIDEGHENWEKEMRSNPEFQKLAKLCHLHGYQLHEAHNEKYPSGRLKRTIRMTPNEGRAEWAKYLPEIYYRHVMKTGEEEFKAQTTSYGTLNKAEFSLFTTAIKHAEELLGDLTDTSFGWDFDSLYIWEMQE